MRDDLVELLFWIRFNSPLRKEEYGAKKDRRPLLALNAGGGHW
jgi:hypothetical protein